MERNIYILDEIIKIKDLISKKQKQLCNYIVLNHQRVGMMTIAELAEEASVGTTTVLRLMKTLKYCNFANFRKDLLESSIAERTSSHEGIKKSFQNVIKSAGSNIFTSLCYETISTFENFINPKNLEQLEKIVQMIIKAKRINLLGLRSSKVAAIYLEIIIAQFYSKARQLSHESDYLFDKAFQLTEEDLLIVFSLWPCTKRTIEVADLCHEKGIPIALVTNTILNPIAKYANAVIDTNSARKNSGILPSIFIAEAIAAGLWEKMGKESADNMNQAEKMLDKYNLFMWERNF